MEDQVAETISVLFIKECDYRLNHILHSGVDAFGFLVVCINSSKSDLLVVMKRGKLSSLLFINNLSEHLTR